MADLLQPLYNHPTLVLMARPIPPIRQGTWYSTDCKLCGGSIERDNVESYRAIRTIPHQENLEHAVPVLGDIGARRIRVGSFEASPIRSLGSLPGLYLVHYRCIKIVRKVTGCNKQMVSLLTLVSILAPSCPADTAIFHPLSDLDGDVLATIFNPASPYNHPDPSPLSSHDLSLRERLHNLTPELLTQILSDCQVEHALAISVGLSELYWRHVIRGDLARQRLTVGIEATRILQDQAYNELYTEKVVELSDKMIAIFVKLGSEIYLQDIKKKSESRETSEYEIEFSLDTPTQLLALQTDHLGIRNVAFRFKKDKTPEFLREEGLLSNTFVDRVDDGSFVSLRIVSDPIKVRMMDIALPNRKSSHPRPLLPYSLGQWVPYSVTTIHELSLPIEGYFEPSYVEISTCTSIYLSYKDYRRLCGIFDENGDDREEVHLGHKPKLRTVRMFGIHCRSFPLGNLPFLQIRTDNGNFLPTMPDIDQYDIIDFQEHTLVKGIWWGKTKCQFFFNVVY